MKINNNILLAKIIPIIIGIVLLSSSPAQARRVRGGQSQLVSRLETFIGEALQRKIEVLDYGILGKDKFPLRVVVFRDITILLTNMTPLGVFCKQENNSGIFRTFYYPFTKREAETILKDILPNLDGNSYELLAPFVLPPPNGIEDYWAMIEYDPEFAKMLDWEEIPMRREIIRWLGNLGFSNGTLYDPMCSTGGFLETVYSAFPEAQFYGSDISEPMVQYAQNNLAGKDNITIFQRDANGGLPDNIPNGTIDVLIFRGLNEVVLTRDIAKAIFTNHIPLLRKGSIVILSGMTDVILYSQFFRENGFRVLNMVNYSEEMIERVPRRKGFYQFYVLVYEGNED